MKDLACCIALGGRYQRAAKAAMLELAHADVQLVKHDGWTPTCLSGEHRHPPGNLSTEALLDGFLDVTGAFDAASPGTFMEPTFLHDPSPWWLAHSDSVPGYFGDDAPCGSVPAPIYRESYTTARDYFNISSSCWPIPARYRDLLGIVHQTPEPLYNDAVMSVMRGQRFVCMYVNPQHMTELHNWFLADLMKWFRANWDVLRDTQVIAPSGWRERCDGEFAQAGMLRQPYGYLHRGRTESMGCFRNPWMDIAELEVPLEPDQPQVVQIYPFTRVLEPHHGRLRVRLAGYETAVFRFMSEGVPGSRDTPDPLVSALASARLKGSVRRSRHDEVGWSVRGRLDRPARLYCLVESGSNEPVGEASAEAVAGGRAVQLEVSDSEAGWSSNPPEHKVNCWRWYVAALEPGELVAEVRLGFKRSLPRSRLATAWLVVPYQASTVSRQGQIGGFPTHPEYEGLASIRIGRG